MLSTPASEFIINGFANISSIVNLNNSQCKILYEAIMHSREFDSLFIDEPSDYSKLKYKGVNPGRDESNFLLGLDTLFIENNFNLNQILEEVLGKNFSVLLKKIICGIPDKFIPDWCLQIVKDKPVPNLGPYIKPQYQDITYFRGIDWHQDIIDYPCGDPRFITLYIYLHDVNEDDAPLRVVPKSHLLGSTKFPHNIQILDEKTLLYSDDNDDNKVNSLSLSQVALTGGTGSVYFWSSSVLHGTTQVNGHLPRISLRYLIERDYSCTANLPIDIVTQSCLNSSFVSVTRDDLDNTGKSVKSGNIIKGIF